MPALPFAELAPHVRSHEGTPLADGSHDSCHLIEMGGKVGPNAVVELQREIAQSFRGGADVVAIDLSAVTILGGGTLGLFSGALRRLSRRGGRMVLVGPPAALRRLVELGVMTDVELCPNLSVAVTASTGERLTALHVDAAGLRAAGTPGL